MSFVFQSASVAQLSARQAEILDLLPGRILQVAPRRPFREPFAGADEVIFVRRGLLSLYRDNALGRRQIIALRYPGESVVPPRHAPEYGIEPIVHSEFFIAPIDRFDAWMTEYAEFRELSFARAERDIRISREWLMNLRQDSTARVAHLLCETAVRTDAATASNGVISPFTQLHIADITAQSSVNVNRVLGDLEQQGLILRNGRRIEFADWPELKRIARFKPAYLKVLQTS